jgi:hypothetical protein
MDLLERSGVYEAAIFGNTKEEEPSGDPVCC